MRQMRSETSCLVLGSRRRVGVCVLILSLMVLVAAESRAQTLSPGDTAEVSVDRANFRASCSLNADIMATLLAGAKVEILEVDGDWYQVLHPATSVEGCLHRTVVGSVEAPSDLREAMERADAERAAATREAAEREAAEREAAEREAAVRAAAERDAAAEEVAERETALDDQSESQDAEREVREPAVEEGARQVEGIAAAAPGGELFAGYFDINIGFATPAVDGMSYSGPVLQGDPPRTIRRSDAQSEYRYDRDLTFGIAAGFLRAFDVGGGIGGGASLTQATYSGELDLEMTRRHPAFPSIIVGDEISTTVPDRQETVLHLHVVYAPPTPEQWRLRFFLGPSFFRTELPVWSAIFAQYPRNPPDAQIESVEFRTQEESVVGGHVGADVAYFFTPRVGFGASAVFSRATSEITVPVPDPGVSLEADFDHGGVSTTVGLRVRF